MASTRMDALLAMLRQNPNDSFARYGVAMEYVRAGNLTEAAATFRELIERNPGYVPAYFHAGQTFEKLGRLEDARRTYEEGIQQASQAGNAHARSELEGALAML